MQISDELFLIETSAVLISAPGRAVTITVAVLELLPGFGSGVLVWTTAVLGNCPGGKVLGTSTSIVTVAVLPGEVAPSVPMLHLIVSVPVQAPWLAEAERNCKPGCNTSVTTTSEADDGPRFVTASV